MHSDWSDLSNDTGEEYIYKDESADSSDSDEVHVYSIKRPLVLRCTRSCSHSCAVASSVVRHLGSMILMQLMAIVTLMVLSLVSENNMQHQDQL